MLDQKLQQRVRQYVTAKFDQLRVQAEEEFSIRCNEMVSRGIAQSSIALSAYNQIVIKKVQRAVVLTWEGLQKSLEARGVAYSDNLAQDLKNELETQVPSKIWRIPDVHLSSVDARFKTTLENELADARLMAMNEAKAEIDLYVDKLQLQLVKEPSRTTRELDQKFKILFSSHQAIRDFQNWQSELASRERPVAVLFVDIDKFKMLNERLLHTKVDQTILPQAHNLIRDLTLARGAGYKYGGDEFVMILPNHDLSEAIAFAEKTRKTFERHEFNVDETTETLTVSIGVAVFPADGSTYDIVLEAANRAMNEAKKTRNVLKLACDLA